MDWDTSAIGFSYFGNQDLEDSSLARLVKFVDARPSRQTRLSSYQNNRIRQEERFEVAYFLTSFTQFFVWQWSEKAEDYLKKVSLKVVDESDLLRAKEHNPAA